MLSSVFKAETFRAWECFHSINYQKEQREHRSEDIYKAHKQRPRIRICDVIPTNQLEKKANNQKERQMLGKA